MKTLPRAALGVGAIVAVLGILQGLASLGVSRLKYLPEPTEVFAAGGGLVGTGEFWNAVGHTAWVSLLGWLIGSAVAVVVGTAVGLSRHAQIWSMSTLDIFRAIPVVAVLPVMVLVLGLTTRMEMYLVVYACLWPVLLNTVAGVSGVNRALHDVGRTLHLGRPATLFKIVLPGSTAQIAVGVNLSLGISLVVSVIAEIIATPAGVGHEVTMAQSALDPPRMFAYIAVSGLLGILFSYGLHLLYGRVRPGILEARR
ncbi:ABC transporter permease [Streptomyces sp. NPDC050560]|uniref:ABC transporter permease n=1 Tax=Streptomyces sp. NPDC050560 TaxID=3365630 RepID=UPI00379E6B31